MPMTKILACLLAAPSLLAAGCGDITPVHADSAAERQDRVYTTGSNIARKPGDIGTPPIAAVGRDAAEQQIMLHRMLPLAPSSQ